MFKHPRRKEAPRAAEAARDAIDQVFVQLPLGNIETASHGPGMTGSEIIPLQARAQVEGIRRVALAQDYADSPISLD